MFKQKFRKIDSKFNNFQIVKLLNLQKLKLIIKNFESSTYIEVVKLIDDQKNKKISGIANHQVIVIIFKGWLVKKSIFKKLKLMLKFYTTLLCIHFECRVLSEKCFSIFLNNLKIGDKISSVCVFSKSSQMFKFVQLTLTCIFGGNIFIFKD